MRTPWRPLAIGAAAAAMALAGVAAPAFAGTTSCTPDVGGTGLSAAVVAHAHQRIANRTIDATGCDVGIYVGAAAPGVTINHVSVTGAAAQGIFAERTSHLRIQNSTVEHNGFGTVDESAPPLEGSGVHSYIGQAFAISVFGVTDAFISGNTVVDNGRGGIGIMDNGPFDPGAMMQNQNPSASLVGSSDITVVGNHMSADLNGCALVAATQNLNGQLRNLRLIGNVITGTGVVPGLGGDVGGIVVAADLPGSSVRDVAVTANHVSNSLEGGVIVNAEAPGSTTQNVRVVGNVLTGNNWGAQEAPQTAGVIVFANPAAAGAPVPPRNIATSVIGNHMSAQFYGVWTMGPNRPVVRGNSISVTEGGVPISFN